MKEVKKKEKPQEWDKKKIILFLIAAAILLVIGFQAKSMMLGENTKNDDAFISSNEDVKGVSIKNPSEDIKENIQAQINNLKTEAENINLVDVASSSPQVQKVINDLKALQDLPSNQLKQTCERICSGL